LSQDSGVAPLVRFARLASEAGTGAAILPLLADALVTYLGADAVAILEIHEEGGATFVQSPHMPKELERLSVDPDLIGEELGRTLLTACGGRFARVRSRPLVCGGSLFGSVAMFFADEKAEGNASLAEGLVDIAAIALDNAAKLHRLARSHTELRRSQETLARAEKLRALGEMAAGVAHDLMNILNPLSLHLQLATRALDAGKTDDVKQSLGEMRQVLTRGVQNIQRLRDYSRQAPETRIDEMDLNRLVHEASEIARPRLASGGRGIRIKEELGAKRTVRGRSGEIVSALVNLIVNAADAMAKTGTTVTLRTGESDDASWVQVADDGPGMPPEVEARVFEPFFTTKGSDGTGLGLAMVYASMRRHGGSVRLETSPGQGACFTLSFPRSASEPPPA
jgi:signal transduction histidine kinase